MKKTGPGPVARRSAAKDTIVKASDAEGKMYKISVKTGSGLAGVAKKLGAVPASLRVRSFNESTDPSTAGISEAEKKKRLDAINKKKK